MWQVISQRPRGTSLGSWPAEDQATIEEARREVEAGKLLMAHKHEGGWIKLVNQKRKYRGEPTAIWTHSQAEHLKSDRLSESAERHHRRATGGKAQA